MQWSLRYIVQKQKGSPRFLKLLQKPGTIVPRETFKLLQKQDKASSRFFQTTSKTRQVLRQVQKHKGYLRFLPLLQKVDTNVPRDS